jgi:hypothetical protein
MMDITFSDVLQTYNGGTGCACGCTGDYTQQGDTSTKVLKRINLLKKNINKVTVYASSDEVIYELENEAGTRVTRIYVKVGA